MKAVSVFDESFRLYGRVLEGYDFQELFQVLSSFEIPDSGIEYVASVPELEACRIFSKLQNLGFGGMLIEAGYCSGHNAALNCLEYHKSSEFNIAKNDIVLLLGSQQEIRDGHYDTKNVKAFYIPAGTGVELYGTTLHYAPCGAEGGGFQVVCILPRGTNQGMPELEETADTEAKMCRGTNKWLLAHPESSEAKDGAYVGLTGENLVYHTEMN